jgi:hypothetical protein
MPVLFTPNVGMDSDFMLNQVGLGLEHLAAQLAYLAVDLTVHFFLVSWVRKASFA